MRSSKYYLSRVYTYYEVVGAVAARNVKLRYKNSLLGFVWSLLNPLLYLAIFIVVFSNAFNMENYPLFILSGLLFYTFFSATSVQVLGSVLESGGILKSLGVPPIVFPISFLISSLVNLLLSLIPFFILMLFFGFVPTFTSLLIIPGIILLALFTLGFSLILCSLHVFFRDIGMFYNSILPAIFYLTPIAYPIEKVPEKFQFFLKLNPLYHFVMYFRQVIYYDKIPDIQIIITTVALAAFTIALGIYVFNSLKKGFISNL